MYLLQQALHQAETRRGFCAPNPAVGAVIVKNNQILATGYHQAAGSPHAEALALNKLSLEQAQSATLYVTLEPCCHTNKRTPPCTASIIQRGIKQVVYAYADPNPQVAGQGAAQLRAAGIEVIHQPLAEIDAFYQSYAHWWRTKMPYVTAKLAMSLDGKIAGPQGQRVQLTGAAAQQFTHQQRKCSDAILTTAKTILKDDPQLNVRLAAETLSKPIYILDSNLSTPIHACIFTTASRVTLLHRKNLPAEKIAALPKENVRYQVIDGVDSGLNLQEVLQFIGQEGVHDLWVEAGGKLFSALLREKRLNRAYLYIAPCWLGAAAQSAFAVENNLLADAKQCQWSNLNPDGLCEMVW